MTTDAEVVKVEWHFHINRENGGISLVEKMLLLHYHLPVARVLLYTARDEYRVVTKCGVRQ